MVVHQKIRCVSLRCVEEVGFVSKEYPEFGCGDPFWGDRYEIIWLALQVRGRSGPVKLVPFEGEGSKETGLLGVLLGDSFFDLRGDHAEAAYDMRIRLKQELANPP